MLYEVITDGDAVADGGGGEPLAGNEHLQQIATVDLVGEAQMVDDVITSYSIHYTKLYELPREAGQDDKGEEERRLGQAGEGHLSGRPHPLEAGAGVEGRGDGEEASYNFV